MRTRSGASFGGCLAVLAALGGCATPASAPSQFTFLHVVPTRVEAGFDAESPARVAVTTSHRSELLSILDPETVLEAGAGSLVVAIERYPGRPDAARPEDHLAPSFVVDYDAEPVRALLASRSGPPPSAEELAGWVQELITASSSREFDIASQVAERRSGDCTEYAVLLAALARAFGHPSRVAIGIVFAADPAGRSAQGFGHAWTEVFEDGRWTPVDATPAGSEPNVLGYLPTGYLDEGPGFALALLRVANRVEDVRLLAPP